MYGYRLGAIGIVITFFRHHILNRFDADGSVPTDKIWAWQ